jgi:hypothetical protein
MVQVLQNRYWHCGWFLGAPVYASEKGKLRGVPGTLIWFDPQGWWNCCLLAPKSGETAAHLLDLPQFIAKGLVAPGADVHDMSAIQWTIVGQDKQHKLVSLKLQAGAQWLNDQVAIEMEERAILQKDVDALKIKEAAYKEEEQRFEHQFSEFAGHYCSSKTNNLGVRNWVELPWLSTAKGNHEKSKGKGKGQSQEAAAAQAKGYSKGYTKGKEEGFNAAGTQAARSKGWSKGRDEGYAQCLAEGLAQQAAQQAAKGKGKAMPPPGRYGWCNKMVCLIGAIKNQDWGKVYRLVALFPDYKFNVLILVVHVLCFLVLMLVVCFLFVFITYAM